MIFEWEYHSDILLLLPELTVSAGVCENPECDASHYKLSVGWLLWSFNIYFA